MGKAEEKGGDEKETKIGVRGEERWKRDAGVCFPTQF